MADLTLMPFATAAELDSAVRHTALLRRDLRHLPTTSQIYQLGIKGIEMKNSKKLAVFAIAATVAFGASAQGRLPGQDNSPEFVSNVAMRVTNSTGGCVRVYAGGQYDLWAGASTWVPVDVNRNYMASVFKGRCGGAAVKNVWFRTSGTQPRWVIR